MKKKEKIDFFYKTEIQIYIYKRLFSAYLNRDIVD